MIEITQEEMKGICSALNQIYSIIGYAQGRADRYAVQRDEWKILQFPTKKKASTGKTAETVFLEFTEKETSKMPKTIRLVIRELNYTVYARKRTTGRYKCSYEIRFNRKGYHISASGRSKEEAKQRFIEKVNEIESANSDIPSVPTNFDKFAMYWFENFHKRKVVARTYNPNIQLYYRHIKARFEKYPIRKINAVMIQNFLDEFQERGKTADDIYSLLNQIFGAAVKHGLIPINPLGMVFHMQHVTEHGTLISKEEELKLLKAYEGTPFQITFALVLYTGLRPNEYPTAVIDGKFIKAVNSKRKGRKVEYKRIPITPMLKPYLEGVERFEITDTRMLDKRLKKVLPNHKLYDMRTTFQTRCTECGIPDNVIGVFMGNSIGALKTAYTDFSDDYLLKEGEKFIY